MNPANLLRGFDPTLTANNNADVFEENNTIRVTLTGAATTTFGAVSHAHNLSVVETTELFPVAKHNHTAAVPFGPVTAGLVGWYKADDLSGTPPGGQVARLTLTFSVCAILYLRLLQAVSFPCAAS